MGEVLGAERTALPGWLAKVHYSPWSAAGGNKCSRKPQPRVVQLNTGNNGHRSTGRGKSRSRWMLVFWGVDRWSGGAQETTGCRKRSHSILARPRPNLEAERKNLATCSQMEAGERYYVDTLNKDGPGEWNLRSDWVVLADIYLLSIFWMDDCGAIKPVRYNAVGK